MGIFAATWLLCWAETYEWRVWLVLGKAASIVDLAVVVYSLVAVTVERGLNVIWWSLEQKRKYERRRKLENRREFAAELEDMTEEERLAAIQRLIDESRETVNSGSKGR